MCVGNGGSPGAGLVDLEIGEVVMRILIEDVPGEKMTFLTRWLIENFFSWRVLPPETILYEPCFDLENPPYEGAEELPEDREPVSMPSQFGPTTRQEAPDPSPYRESRAAEPGTSC
jgi:hypothetical protein